MYYILSRFGKILQAFFRFVLRIKHVKIFDRVKYWIKRSQQRRYSIILFRDTEFQVSGALHHGDSLKCKFSTSSERMNTREMRQNHVLLYNYSRLPSLSCYRHLQSRKLHQYHPENIRVSLSFVIADKKRTFKFYFYASRQKKWRNLLKLSH